MKNKLLLTATGIFLAFSICLYLIIVFNYESGEAKNALTLTQAKLEEEKLKNNQLQEDNSKLTDTLSSLETQIKDNELSLQQLRAQNATLQDSIEKTKAKLSDSGKYAQGLREESLKLQSQMQKLKSKNESLNEALLQYTAAQEEREQEQIQIQNRKEELKGLLEQYGISKLVPSDYVSDYSGNESFLKDCTSELCKKIKLNISGIDYAKNMNFTVAERYFKDALKTDPSFIPAKLNLGLVYQMTKPAQEAFDYWRQTLGGQ
jgi:chromosome segregation ATPase